MDKAEQVFKNIPRNEFTKEAIAWANIAAKIGKGLATAKTKVAPLLAKGKGAAKNYGKSIQKDFRSLKATAKSKEPYDKMLRGRAAAGLAGRVGLPGYVAGDVLT
jgi:hypothetical protein